MRIKKQLRQFPDYYFKKSDVHQRRLQSIDKDYEFNLLQKNSLYFVNPKLFKPLNLDDVNQLNYDNNDNIKIVPTLLPELDAVVKKPGIYPINQFTFSKNYRYLRDINRGVDISLFDQYVPPSQDKTLFQIAQVYNLKYIVSTSTVSSFLSQIFFMISGFRNPDFNNVFTEYENEPRKHMVSFRKPISIFLHKISDHILAMDSDKGLFEEEVVELMNTGKILERLMTMPEEEFVSRYVTPDNKYEQIEDFHRFMILNNEMCLRSQIDCRSTDENGNPFVFEIKTRALSPIRYDYLHFYDYLDYELKTYKGQFESFEREYYDLIRGAFIKWCFQIKIGRMDGAFIAYHNINQVQGFEYVKASEMYRRIFGSEAFSDAVFQIGSKLMTTIIDELKQALIHESYQSIKLGVSAQNQSNKLVIFAELIQNMNDIKIIKRDENIKDEYDYYKKFQLTNKVLKFEVLTINILNGLEMNRVIDFREGDVLGIKYYFRCLGLAEFNDYMNFLHDCYKFDELNFDSSYSGAWIKNQ